MEGVFDEGGFYKTGDLFRREGSDYFMLGRASQDSKSFPLLYYFTPSPLFTLYSWIYQTVLTT